MKNTNIGSRLLMAASFVDCGKTVCDVGCDHGKLSLYLICSQKAQHIIATDINPKPLQKAVDLFGQNGLSEKARFLLCDGLSDIKETDDISHVVIAGLGGETMAQIIEKASFIKENKVKLVLLPAQSGAKIRKYLYENGFEILKETTVKEKKKFYSCISAQYSAKPTKPSLYDCFIGKSCENTDDSARGYFEMVLSQLEKKQSGQLIDKGSADLQLSQTIEKVKTLISKL